MKRKYTTLLFQINRNNRLIEHNCWFSRHQELIAANEKKKAEIKRRDDLRKAKQEKQMHESMVQASLIMAQKRQQLDYCTKQGAFGGDNA